ncbi:MAG: DUF1302 domain-containing protein [Pseudomonadota bacterium]
MKLENEAIQPWAQPPLRAMARACAAALAALALGASPGARAEGFTLANGDQGQWSASASLGSAWRTAGADRGLYSKPYGGTASGGNQNGDLNFGKWEAFSTPLTLSGEVQLKHDQLGFVLGARAWYDYTLEHGTVPIGSANNGFVANTRLNDNGFYGLSKFSGVALGNAYLFGTFEPLGKPLTVKLGNQVVNWGESLFISGLNQFGAYNLAAVRQPGSTVKDALLPIPQLSVNWGLADGVSLEGFYQLAWRHNVADGCGTFWSASDLYNCSMSVSPVLGDAVGTQFVQLQGTPLLHGLNFAGGALPEKRPRDSGQFGLALHYYAPALSTDFGAYFATYHQRSPMLTMARIPSPDPRSLFSGNYTGKLGAAAGAANILTPLSAYWDYSVTGIQVAGVSAAAEIGGWALAGEASYTRGLPVQINSADMLVGVEFGKVYGAQAGPQAALASLPLNSVMRGYDLHNKAQLQMNATKVIAQVAGASALTLVGEIGAQRWSGIGDASVPGTVRYGRGFAFGFASANAAVCAALNANPSYCAATGFATTSAWGYRLQGELNYQNALAGWNLKPRLFWSHDVHGYSADGSFVQDRKALGMAVRADYLNKYYAQLSYARFNHRAVYDVLHDRDNVAAVFGVNF